jgi:hypothetical protein
MEDEMLSLVRRNSRQISSGLMRAFAASHGMGIEQRRDSRYPKDLIHFHDGSTNGIAFNDVDAIQMYNELTGDNIPVPFTATESYNEHHHAGFGDGGYIPGMGPHDHRDNFNGGFAFACYHPGTSIPGMPWAM